MIRYFEYSDMEQVLDIWLEASIKAHDFIDKDFWKSKVNDMRDKYLTSAETYVYVEEGIIRGFCSLSGETLAAIFVSPDFQGKGIGQQLISKVKSLRRYLNLTVYKYNHNSIDFYKKSGFKILKEQVDKHTGHAEILMEYKSNKH